MVEINAYAPLTAAACRGGTGGDGSTYVLEKVRLRRKSRPWQVDAPVRYRLSGIRVSAKDSLIAEQHEKATALAGSRHRMSAMRLEENKRSFPTMKLRRSTSFAVKAV